MILLVSFIVKFFDVSWAIWARAVRICADCCCRRCIGMIVLALDGPQFSNWHCINSFRNATSSVWVGVLGRSCSFSLSVAVTV